MHSQVVFVEECDTSLGRDIVALLRAAGFDPRPGLPLDPHQPVVIAGNKDVLTRSPRYRELSYCLVLSSEQGLPCPSNVTYLSPQAGRERHAVSLGHWLAWVALDREESLESCQLLGRSLPFCELVRNLHSAARFGAATLLTGETGTGKEVAARALHYWSARKDQPFVAVNCGGQNDDLFLAELFGHERGAFTGANDRREGLIVAAEGGTLFLDEINSLSAKAQAALLRFMQDQTYRALGSRRVLQSDVRIVAATNQSLEELTNQGRFRTDLFYRLHVLSVALPTLRERRHDIPLLARHFLERLATRYDLPPKRLDPRTLELLLGYDWPGNVRELENYLHRVFALTEGPVVTAAPKPSLSPRERVVAVAKVDADAADVAEGEDVGPFQTEKAAAIEHFERSYIQRVLTACGGNISQAARVARKERRTFGRLVRKYGLSTHNESAVSR